MNTENFYYYINSLTELDDVMTSHDDDMGDPKDSRAEELLSMDEVFLKRLEETIEENLDVKDFGVDELGKEIGMSRSQIHRKLQALTGKSASRYIRSHKLTKARELLEKNVGTVSEISFRMGFSSPAYFGQVFLEEFGYPPSEVPKKIEEGTSASEGAPPKSVRRLAAIMFKLRLGSYPVLHPFFCCLYLLTASKEPIA